MAEFRVSVRVKPGSSRAKVGGSHDGALIVAVNAQPVDGAANKAVTKALAEACGLKPRQVCVVAGHTARTKVIAIDCERPEEIASLLEALLDT